MKSIKRYLIAIFLLLLGIGARVYSIGYETGIVLNVAAIALPLLAVAVFIFALIDDRFGNKK